MKKNCKTARLTLFRPSQMRTMIHVVPVKDVYHVNLTFPIEDLQVHYASRPEGYLAQLIGHKGPRGLFSQLRAQGLASHVVAGRKNLARGLAFFVVTVQMTEVGERKVDEVVKSVFQYINLLRGRVIMDRVTIKVKPGLISRASPSEVVFRRDPISQRAAVRAEGRGEAAELREQHRQLDAHVPAVGRPLRRVRLRRVETRYVAAKLFVN